MKNKQQDREAQLLQQYEGMIVLLVNKFRPPNISNDQWYHLYQDYKQVGYIGALKAIRQHKPKLGGSLSAGIWYYVKWALLNHIQENTPLQLMYEPTTKIRGGLTINYVPTCLYEILPSNLSQLEIEILEMKYGGYTCAEIARRLGYSNTWIHKILNASIEKVRNANAT